MAFKVIKRLHGETEPVQMHEMPSYAAKKEAFFQQHGRYPSTPAEKKLVRDAGTSEAVTIDVHRQTRTYKGRNTKKQIAEDARDLTKAQQIDELDLVNAKKAAKTS